MKSCYILYVVFLFRFWVKEEYEMSSKIISLSLAILLGISLTLPALNVQASDVSGNDSSVQTVKANDNDDATYYISNREIFDAMQKQGVDVQSILSPEEYQSALNQDMLRQGSNWLHKYTYKGHSRITVGVNSAIVKLMKYGGQGGVYAIQALLAARGMPMDAGAAAGIHGTLASINASKGHWWHIDLKTHKVVAHGNQ